ncbi:TMEM175 family protein [Riemerella columbina]|uniref:TMEM175 family protein n=1 Tax=Riemerella columbina TaxID=103810 RepID=UPI002670886A|nr:TMEM175 family protein [Riemerella columbina]WKS94482.1 TMEM175 family protein [Riemerella columbina]
MTTSRLEAFSDGVLAIVITIMVLEMKAPEGADFQSLMPVVPKFLSYILSFIYIGIYWNNHHHLFQAIEKINGTVLWANLLLLFALSLVPFTTAWMGENHFDKNPVTLYGINLLFCAFGYIALERSTLKVEGKGSKIEQALKSRTKEYTSISLYIVGLLGSYFAPIIGMACYTVVAILWLCPDRRIEKTLKS